MKVKWGSIPLWWGPSGEGSIPLWQGLSKEGSIPNEGQVETVAFFCDEGQVGRVAFFYDEGQVGRVAIFCGEGQVGRVAFLYGPTSCCPMTPCLIFHLKDWLLGRAGDVYCIVSNRRSMVIAPSHNLREYICVNKSIMSSVILLGAGKLSHSNTRCAILLHWW